KFIIGGIGWWYRIRAQVCYGFTHQFKIFSLRYFNCKCHRQFYYRDDLCHEYKRSRNIKPVETIAGNRHLRRLYNLLSLFAGKYGIVTKREGRHGGWLYPDEYCIRYPCCFWRLPVNN